MQQGTLCVGLDITSNERTAFQQLDVRVTGEQFVTDDFIHKSVYYILALYFTFSMCGIPVNTSNKYKYKNKNKCK